MRARYRRIGMWAKVVLTISALVVLSACSNEVPLDSASEPLPTSEPTASPLKRGDYEGLWKLVEGTGPEGDVPADEWDITAHIEGKRIFGTTGCNDFGGTIKVVGATISKLLIGGTEEGCGKPEAEPPYKAAMFAATDIARDGDLLILTGPETRLIFESVPPPPIGRIAGRRWRLVRILDGQTSEEFRSIRPRGEASFLIDRDGTWGSTTGCQRLKGEWIVEGDRIMSTQSRSIGGIRGCSEAAFEQWAFISNAFSEGFASVLQGKKLTIASDWGQYRLVYRAEK